AGVAVRVIYDALGSIKANRKIFADMRARGVSVVAYRPLMSWRPRAGWLGRNHRKTLVVDGKTAFTGGMNLANAYSAKASGGRGWRDTAVRVDGPAARDCDEHFRQTWNTVTREHLLPPEPWEKPGHPAGCPCVVIGSYGLKQRRAIRRLYSVQLGLALDEVQMTVPYFAPPRRLRRALYLARARGLPVRVLVSRDTDVPMADWVREGLYPDLLLRDIEVHEYNAGVMHAKTMVVDGHVAVVGSANFDYVSVALNLELAIVVFDEEIARRLTEQYEKDLEGATRLSADWALSRPWWRRWMARVGAFVIRKL
ncbi:MAG: phosphatidylserine/phosphatidylglycerophosphate/cardiolipin synthase family protein, partial [Akkermansiaceae bacterium]|nr:phosphatidylserine/phosphatidylglycerophosphate/cardiolipin synthase family protein [Akkermansiaceae bacterium]